jgi:subtilisin family serine protease
MKSPKFLTPLVLASLIALAPQDAMAAATDYIVTSTSGTLTTAQQNAIAAAGGTIESVIEELGMARVSADASFASASISGATVGEDLSFDFTGETLSMTSQAVPAPPFTNDDDFFFDLQWGHTAIGATEAWAAGARGDGVKVAVLDTGFDLDHPDLAANIVMAASTVDGEPNPDFNLPGGFSHGSHVAGTIAAPDNGFGIIGVAPEADLMLIKVLSDAGWGSFFDIAEGIVMAADNGAQVINMSLGGGGPRHPDAQVAAYFINMMNSAVAYAHQKGATVIVAAGNDSHDGDGDGDFWLLPAMSPHAITVSALGPNGWGFDPYTNLDGQAFYTNSGQSLVDISAPGGDVDFGLYGSGDPAQWQFCSSAAGVVPCWALDMVFSADVDGYRWAIGTSMASPHAAGVAALIIGAADGNMTPAQVRVALETSADDLGKPGVDDVHGAGRVNAAAAVQ